MNKRVCFDWEIKEALLMNHATQDIISGQKVIYRDDNNRNLGVVTDRYESVSNESFNNMANKLEDSGCKYLNHGEFALGKKLWVQFESTEMPSDTVGDSKIESNILLVNGHAGALPFELLSTLIRVICENTFIAARQKGDVMFRFKHTKSVHTRIAEAESYVTQLGRATSDVLDVFEHMSKLKFEKEPKDFFTKLLNYEQKPRLRKKNGDKYWTEPIYSGQAETTLERLLLNYQKEDGIKGTNWGMFNAVTHYVDHDANSRSDDYAWFGTGNKLKQRAFFELAQDKYSN